MYPGLELPTVPLPQPSKHWDYWYMQLCPAQTPSWKNMNAWHNPLSCLGNMNLPLLRQAIFPVVGPGDFAKLSLAFIALGIAVAWCAEWLLSVGFSPLVFWWHLAWSFFFWESECTIYRSNIWFPTQSDAFLRVLRRYPCTTGCQLSWNSHIWTKCEFILKWAYVSCSVNSSVKQTFVKHPLNF